MQVMFSNPDEFGNNGGMYRGQGNGYTQNNLGGGVNQGNGLNHGSQGGMNPGLGQRTNGGGNANPAEQPRKRGRCFASMDPARVSEIASMGGKAAHQQGVAHEWTPEEARRAGRKGGQSSRGNGSAEGKSQGVGGSF